MMFEIFSELTTEQQLNRLVQPRGDWFGVDAIQQFFVRMIPVFSDLGVSLPEAEKISSICSARELHQHIWRSIPPRGVKGLIADAPQHAGIVKLIENSLTEPRRLKLAAFVIVFADDWRRRLQSAELTDIDDEAALFRRLSDVWRAIRLLSIAGLNLLPQISLNIHTFHDELEMFLSSMDPRDSDELGRDAEYLKLVLRFVNYYLGGGRIYVRGLSSEAQQQIEKIAKPIPTAFDPDTELDLIYYEQSATQRPLDGIRNTEHFKAGNSPDEVEDGPRLDVTPFSVDFRCGGDLKLAAIRKRSRLVHQRRAAQQLPGHWAGLNDDEIRKVLDHVAKIADRERESVVTLLLMLLTGRDFEAVRRARVVKYEHQVSQQLEPESVVIISENQGWATGALTPSARRKLKSEWRPVFQDHGSRLVFSIPSVFWRLIGPLATQSAATVTKRSAAMFKNKNDSRASDSIKQLLSDVNSGRRARLTKFRIAHQLLDELHRTSQDSVEASLITGRQMPFGQSAAIYYHHCDRQTLVDHYAAVTERWSAFVEGGAVAVPTQKAMFDGSVGSNLVPETDTIRGLFKALREQAEADRERVSVLGGLRQFHNSYTNYALMVLFWTTGYRAVQDPIAAETEINMNHGFIVIADKTGDGMGHSRMVPICRLLADQMADYERHVHWLRSHLTWSGADVMTDTFFFYLDENGKSVKVRPASMTKNLEWGYVLPLNLNRHWLRGALRAEGVPGPQVDRFMGHWAMGREPWSKFSAVDPHEYRRVLTRALDSLMDQLDIQVLEGMA